MDAIADVDVFAFGNIDVVFAELLFGLAIAPS